MTNITRKLVLLAALLCFAALIGGCSDTPTYQVNDLASDPEAFTKELTVVGIVNTYAPNDPTLVGIMDMKELQCNTPNCSKVLLPVRHKGPRPAIGAQIKASGIIQDKTLNATSLEIVAMHNLGGQK